MKKLRNKLIMFQCPKCSIYKDRSFFYIDKRYRNERPRICKECKRKYSREKNWIYRDNLNVDEVNSLRKVTKYCQICNKEKPLHVDHNHVEGNIRGLLCSSCNKGLGLFYDNPDYLRNAIEYLGKAS